MTTISVESYVPNIYPMRPTEAAVHERKHKDSDRGPLMSQ